MYVQCKIEFIDGACIRSTLYLRGYIRVDFKRRRTNCRESLSLSLSCGPLFVVARRRCRHRRGEEEVRGSDRGRVGQRLETAIKQKLQGKPSEKSAETVFNAANNASFLRKITLIVTGRPLHAAITGLSRIRKRMQFLLLLLHLLLLRAACTPEIKRCLSS